MQSLKKFRDTLDFCLMYRVKHFKKINESNCQRNLANEIVANLLERSLVYSEDTKSAFDNLLHYFKINSESLLKNINNPNGDDLEEPGLARLRRYEKRIREMYENITNISDAVRNHRPLLSYMKSQQKGRYYDKSLLEFLSWNFDIGMEYNLILLTLEGRINKSKKTSSLTFAEAFRLYDQKYEEAKAKKNPSPIDKLEYIFKWINFYRIESYFHFSLIAELSEQFSETKKDFILPHLNKIFGSGIGTKNRIVPAYQILRNEKYVTSIFSVKNEDELSNLISLIFEEREVEDLLIYAIEDRITKLFEKFYKQDKMSINEIYNFCLKDYPIIENHKKSGFYKDYKKSLLNKSQIRYARKIISNTLPFN